ncbi:MAG: preprotein translocase subunit SecE [Bacteroidaceae bacterium]|nr:preprotein translocase subunit SecE [Bacteroidaceae bacterium]
MLNKVITYCKDSYVELTQKTTWPSRVELTHSAIVVLIASIVIALAVFFVDTLIEWVMKFVYNV